MSNSKLSPVQKLFRRDAKSDHIAVGGSIATVGRFTVAIVPEFPGSNMARMSVSFASEDETKLRRKVGEFHALFRLQDNKSVPVPVNFDATDMAELMNERYTYG
jgi:hypothetical protein